MTQTLSLRASAQDMDILEAVRGEGESTTSVLRRVLRAAQVLADRESMRQQSLALAADAEDLAEMREVQKEMNSLCGQTGSGAGSTVVKHIRRTA